MASVEALVTGDPEEDETFCGAVNSKQHYQKVFLQFAAAAVLVLVLVLVLVIIILVVVVVVGWLFVPFA